MESIGLVALIALLLIAGLLISYRLTTIAVRFVRFSLLKRTSMILPAVRPQPPSQSTARRVSSHLPTKRVAAHPTPPPKRSSPTAPPYSRTINRLPHDTGSWPRD